MRRLIIISVACIMMMMSVCTLLIINELQQIRQAIMENPAQVNYEIK